MQALAELGFTQTFDLVHYEGNLLYVVAADAAGAAFFPPSYLHSAAINSCLRLTSERASAFRQMGTAELRQSEGGGARWLRSADGMSRSPPRLALHHLHPAHLRPSWRHVAFTLHFPAVILAR